MSRNLRSRLPVALGAWTLLTGAAHAATYDVGPGQPLAAVGDVPWESLAPGDVVAIHWRPTPYFEKFVIGTSGTLAQPIVVRGVPGPAGELPVLDGANATTRRALDYWSETRGIVKIGGTSVPPDTTPRYIVIDGLEIRGARSSNTFTDDAGNVVPYDVNASSIYLELGEHVTVRGCVLHDCSNGFFVASSAAAASRDILVEGCHLYDNGNVGRFLEHGNYTAAIGIVFQYNWFGPLLPGAGGNNLKDRSAGLVVRYNWIEGGNRQLDLVDAEDSSLIEADPGYRDTWVYGNVLIERDGDGNRQILHYGGDSGLTGQYRKGTLHFYGNTVISYRSDRTTLMRLSTPEEHCDARGNIVDTVAAAGSTLSLLDQDGILDWSHQWTKPGWVPCFGTLAGTINDDGTSITGPVPGFADEVGQDFHLAAGSPCVDAGAALEPAALPDHDLVAQYGKHRSSEVRPRDAPLDIGAYELGCVVGAPPGRVVNLRMLPDARSLQWDAEPSASAYDVVVGDVGRLRALGLAASVTGCLVSDDPATSAMDPAPPPAGGGLWYLVRARSCGVAGTWDGGSSAQRAPRDPPLAAAAAGCP